ncbi:MAG: ribonuclease III [Lachnospiraceae bacterium]|nr:ribonuclease III [Lachnospiraceae bacterium]
MEESVSLLSLIKKSFDLKEVDIRTYSPLTLAYIGDAVYDLIIRTVVVERGNTSANKLHKQAIEYVKAPAQAKLIEAIQEELTEEEAGIYRRGKNAKPYTMAKNATMNEYKKATGLEALVGYLYLTDRVERILELLQIGLHKTGIEK